jgi:hypothetical protein
MPEIWIERYLDERLAPLREELGALDARARTVQPIE